jgi:hypothetical protein
LLLVDDNILTLPLILSAKSVDYQIELNRLYRPSDSGGSQKDRLPYRQHSSQRCRLVVLVLIILIILIAGTMDVIAILRAVDVAINSRSLVMVPLVLLPLLMVSSVVGIIHQISRANLVSRASVYAHTSQFAGTSKIGPNGRLELILRKEETLFR